MNEPPQGVAISLHSVRKSFGETVALAPTDLEIPAGRTVALIGPSGCGKSTILRLVIGLLEPDAGRIQVGDLMVEPRNHREVRSRVGYVIQEGGLFPHLTAAENAALKARDLGWIEARVAARLAELGALVHLPPELLGRLPAELSGGQRQRVGLMRALLLDPGALLLDEPLGALDPVFRSRLQEELREIFRALRKTVLLVTHDMGEAAYLADEIVLMREGRIVQRGTFAELLERPAEPFVTEFIRAQRSPAWSALGAPV